MKRIHSKPTPDLKAKMSEPDGLGLPGPDVPACFWYTVHPKIRPLALEEMYLGPLGGPEDDRTVTFWRRGLRRGSKVPTWFRVYRPVENQEVLPELLRVFGGPDKPRDYEVFRFYRNFGPLDPQGYLGLYSPRSGAVPKSADPSPQELEQHPWLKPKAVTSEWIVEAIGRPDLPEDTQLGFAEPVWWVRLQALELAKACALYAHLQQNEPDRLKQDLGPVPKGRQLMAARLVDAGRIEWWAPDEQWMDDDEHPGPRRELSDEEAVARAAAILVGALNATEARVRRRWVGLDVSAHEMLDPEEAFPESAERHFLKAYRTVWAHSLRDALWLQLSEKAAANALLRSCRGCGIMFYPKRRNQLFHSPECGNRDRQRRFQSSTPRRKA